MGLLDNTGFDPQTQGLLAAAFRGLQASGPSRMPVSLGQIIGQGGEVGLNEYQQAMQMAQKKKRDDALMELEKMKGQLTQAQIDKMKAETGLLSGLGGLDMKNPDQLDAAASKLMMVSPEKASALMTRSKDLRATQQEGQTLSALRPTQGLIGDIPTQGIVNGVPATRFNVPQGDTMIQPPGATEPIPQSVLNMGNTPYVANPTERSQLIPSPLMGGLLSSQAPGVASAAGGLTQMMANPAFNPKSSLVESQIEKLRASDTAAQNSALARRDSLDSRLAVVDAIAANRAPPAEKQPHYITNADGVFQVKADGTTEQVKGPDGKPLTGKTTADKAVPASIAKSYMENAAALRKIDSAFDEVAKRPGSFGLQNMVGNTVSQRTDPEGVKARALVADIGSLKIHDRSGASVTVSESPRLLPFIPGVNDKAGTIKKKLALFKAEYEAIQNDFKSIYGEDQGYKPLPEASMNRRASDKSSDVIDFNALPK